MREGAIARLGGGGDAGRPWRGVCAVGQVTASAAKAYPGCVTLGGPKCDVRAILALFLEFGQQHCISSVGSEGALGF